jgi:hypothetical protein
MLTLTLLFAATAAMLQLGCENTSPSPEQYQQLEEVTKAYLNDLADAYSNRDVSMLSRHASRREIDEVRKLLDKLEMTGDRLQATLLHVDIQEIEVFRVVNGTVKLIEVWDVGRYDAYDGREKARNPSSIQRSVIQLRRIEGEWKVVGRRVKETQGGSKWQFDDTESTESTESTEPTTEGAG